MALWTIRCYLDLNGVDVIDEWVGTVSDAVAAKFDVRMRYLQEQPHSAWTRPHFDSLGGDCSGLGEVRFQSEKVQYRPIGFFSAASEFTLLFVAIEKDRKFVPKSACDIAQRRKKEVEADRRRARDCEFDQ